MALDRPAFYDMHGPGFADTAQVIAHQVHDHVQFGSILFRIDQFTAGGGGRARSLDRSCHDIPVFDLQEQLGTEAQDNSILMFISARQFRIEPISWLGAGHGFRCKGSRRDVDVCPESTGEIYLEDIACVYVLDNSSDLVGVPGAIRQAYGSSDATLPCRPCCRAWWNSLPDGPPFVITAIVYERGGAPQEIHEWPGGFLGPGRRSDGGRFKNLPKFVGKDCQPLPPVSKRNVDRVSRKCFAKRTVSI